MWTCFKSAVLFGDRRRAVAKRQVNTLQEPVFPNSIHDRGRWMFVLRLDVPLMLHGITGKRKKTNPLRILSVKLLFLL